MTRHRPRRRPKAASISHLPSAPKSSVQPRHMKIHQKLLLGAGAVAGFAAVRRIRRQPYDFRGKSVMITGGSRGLGLLLAREFLSRGARVAICARDAEELDRARQQLQTDVLTVPVDVTIREEAELAVAKVSKAFGAIDVLVNNAGIIGVGP